MTSLLPKRIREQSRQMSGSIMSLQVCGPLWRPCLLEST